MPRKTSATFLDLGDLTAPKGTPRWCIAVREEARTALMSEKTTREQVRNWVRALREENNFQKLTNAQGQHFLSWETFCPEPPPYGFGMSSEEVDAIIDSKPLAQQMASDPDVKSLEKHGRPQKGSDTTFNPGRGVEYLVRRLKRDHPEIARDLAKGKYPSARAAAIAAGIVKVPSPYDLLCRAWDKASGTERDRFMTEKNQEGW